MVIVVPVCMLNVTVGNKPSVVTTGRILVIASNITDVEEVNLINKGIVNFDGMFHFHFLIP